MWLCLLIVVPELTGVVQAVMAGLLVVIALFVPTARRFLWRTRFLFLALILILPWTTPGVYAWPGLGVWSPTQEGLLVAGQQLARSLIVLTTLGLMLHGLDLQARLVAVLGFLVPLARIGVPVERLAVRLVLTLQWLEAAPLRRRWQEWQAAWVESLHAHHDPVVVDIEIGRWQWLDYLLAMAAVLGVLVCVGR